ncbi:MAG: amidohydrolase family protein, partial [Hylemonella sp.]
PDAQVIAQALVAANPQRMLWGTDWPHPGAWHGQPRSPEVIEPFHPIDDERALQRISEWVSAEHWLALLETNPTRLYDF